MYCYYCGKENKEEQSFCKYCGKSLHPKMKNEVPDPVESNQGSLTEETKENEPVSKQQSEALLVKYVNKESKLIKILVAVIAALVIVLGIFGFCVYKHFRGDGSSQFKTTEKENESTDTEGIGQEIESDIDKEKSDQKQKKNTSVAESSEEHVEAIVSEEVTSNMEEELDEKEILIKFLSNEMTASIFGKEMSYSDMRSIYLVENNEYRDVNNDGIDELLIYSEVDFSPVMVLEVENNKIKELCSGDGTAAYLQFYDVDGVTWACYSDTTHQGRQSYDFVLYNGSEIEDEFTLSAEYPDNENDRNNKNSVFTYRDHTITMQEYETILEKYTGIKPESIEESTEIKIERMPMEEYGLVSYKGYYSTLGSENFRFVYPTNLYMDVVHDYNINNADSYGTLIEKILFTGAEGSSLEYKMYRRIENYSKEDMLNAVYLNEITKLSVIPGADPNILSPKVNKGYGLSVISGWNEDGSKIVYEVIDVEDNYILMMRVITPNTETAKAVTNQLYDGCGFNGRKLWE